MEKTLDLTAGPFHVFWGDAYEPAGGLHDYHGSYPTLAEAQAAVPQAADWAHIIVVHKGKLQIVCNRYFEIWTVTAPEQERTPPEQERTPQQHLAAANARLDLPT